MLLRHHDKRNLTIKEYCFDLQIISKNYDFLINPIVCGETIVVPWFKIWGKFKYSKFCSIVFKKLCSFLQQWHFRYHFL